MNQSSQITNSTSDQNIETLHKIEAELNAEDEVYYQNCEKIAANVSVLSLPWLPFNERVELPNVPGIYFVLEDDRVIYIGLSKISILRRWWTHPKIEDLAHRKGEIKIAWLECRATELLPVIESALIDRFGKPELNLKWGNRIVPIGQSKTRWTDIDENIQRRLVALRRTDWALVEEVAKKLQVHPDEALMWIVRLGASATPGRYYRMLKKLEKELKL